MPPPAARRFHHVANGSSTADLIERAGLPGTRSIWADPLHEGPVPEGLGDAELLLVRARFLAEAAGAAAGEVAAELESWRTPLDALGASDEVVLWYEHDLFDQLNLIQLLDRIRATAAGARPVTLISIGAFPGRPSFKGLGELTPAELGSLFETRAVVSDAQYELAHRAWLAIRSPDPRSIERLFERDLSALAFLEPALRRHLEELPWTRDGLSRTERRVLELARDAPIDVREAFARVSEGETAFYVGDSSFWRIVESLESVVPALIHVSTSGKPRRDVPLPAGTITLTGAGRSVLARALDRVGVCGVDRWLGGVHLEGNGPLWRYDSESRGVVLR